MVEREGRQSTREKLLTAARDMVLERFAGDTSPADALSYLTPAAVAERAQVSRGSLYHYWGDAAERSTGDPAASTDAATPFRRFLNELAESLWDTSTGLEDLTLVALSLPPNVSDVVLALTAFEVIRRTAGPAEASWRATLAMTAHHAEVTDEVRASTERMARVYEAMLPRLGLRLRAPLTSTDLAQTLGSLSDGMILNEMFDAGSVTRPIDWDPRLRPEGADIPWTLYAIAVEGVVWNMTEPVPDPAPPDA